MDINQALKGLLDAKRKLESTDAINIPTVLSTQMDRLATYTSSVEEHLAELEKQFEEAEAEAWHAAIKEGKSPSAAKTIAEYEVAKIKGEIKRLTRLVNSSWRLCGIKQSRYNHLINELKNQV